MINLNRFSRGNRLAALLSQQPSTNDGTHLGGLASVLTKALIGHEAGQQEARDASIRKDSKGRLAAALQAMQPQEGQTVVWNQPDARGNQVTHTPARAADPARAAMLLAESQDPALQKMGVNMVMQQASRREALGDERRQRKDARDDYLFRQQNKAMPPQADPASVQEFKFAQANGFKGNFTDFITAKKRAGATHITNTVGPKGVDYGDPEKGLVWQRDAFGKIVLDDRGAPIALPYQGGSVFQEQQAAEQSAQASRDNQTRAGDVVITDIGRALDTISSNPNLSTGMGARATSWIGGSPAGDVASTLQTIRANVGFDRLQRMRNASKTGGALGAINQTEMDLLTSALGSVEQSQSREQLEYNLKRLQNIYLDIVHGQGSGNRWPLAAPENLPGAARRRRYNPESRKLE